MRLANVEHGHVLRKKLLMALIRVVSGVRVPDIVRTLFYRGFESTTLEANPFTNTIDVHNVITPVTIRANGGNDRVNVGDAPQVGGAAIVSVDTGAEQSSATAPFGDELVVNSDAGAGDALAVVQLAANDSIERLTVNAGGTLRIPAGTTARITGQLQLPGTIDLAGGILVTSTAAAPSALRSWLLNGFAGGAWNGTSAAGAIHSQAANAIHGLGYGSTGASGEPSPLAITSLGGFSIGSNTTVVRYTRRGDANLDSAVNIDDYGRIDSHVGTPGAIRWVEGNFNYDGAINIDDYGIIDGNIGRQTGSLEPISNVYGGGGRLSGIDAVPEPGGLAAILVAGGALARRPRRE